MSPVMTTPLDEISLKLGELTAYTHEHRHGVANLSQKMDGLILDVAKQIAALEAKMTVRLEETHTSLSQRLCVLEGERQRRDGAASVVQAVLKSPAIGWLVGGATAAWALLTGKVNL